MTESSGHSGRRLSLTRRLSLGRRNSTSSSHPVIVVHGGAWNIPDNLVEPSKAGVCRAAQQAYAVMQGGGTAVDAVERAVQVLEDDPAFNAGTGSIFNANGEIEMDAIIMDGKELKTGAVACVKNIKNPVSLAKMVMEKTQHTLLVGPGANEFAKEMNISEVDPISLLSDEAKEEYNNYKEFKPAVAELINKRRPSVSLQEQAKARRASYGRSYSGNYDCSIRSTEIIESSADDQASPRVTRALKQEDSVHSHDTVGAVAIDTFGDLACATSTGGITAKRPGRVGDGPIVGAGAYADSSLGAVSCTGHGESISKVCLAHRVISNLRNGLTAEKASKEALDFMWQRVGGCGGVIVLTPKGCVSTRFTTSRMAWASMKSGMLTHGIEPGDEKEVPTAAIVVPSH